MHSIKATSLIVLFPIRGIFFQPNIAHLQLHHNTYHYTYMFLQKLKFNFCFPNNMFVSYILVQKTLKIIILNIKLNQLKIFQENGDMDQSVVNNELQRTYISFPASNLNSTQLQLTLVPGAWGPSPGFIRHYTNVYKFILRLVHTYS